MAQITKSLTNKEPKPPKNGLEELPEVIPTSRKPKISKSDKRKFQRPRVGHFQPGLNLNGKPEIIENGNKIK